MRPLLVLGNQVPAVDFVALGKGLEFMSQKVSTVVSEIRDRELKPTLLR